MEPAARARLYAFLSRLFAREIDDGFAQVLAGEQGRAVLPAFSRSAECDALFPVERRQAIFDTDFANVTMVNAVPYESFYRREDAMIESGAVNPLSTFLRAYGFEADLEIARSLSADHLGIELELMAILCRKEAESSGDEALSARAVQRKLLEEHLLAWAPIYLLAVKRTARTELYRDGADAVLHLLHQHHEALA